MKTATLRGRARWSGPARRALIAPVTLTRSQPPTPTRAQGFTLIELLVVIAVIALLIGILLPSLGAAKEAGKQTQCAAHLRQVGVAVSAYAVSAKGYYSSGRFDNRQNSGSGPIDEVGWLADMMLGEYCNPGKMLCPTNPARLSQALTSGRLTDRPSKAFNIPDDQAELVRRGFNTNYTMSWYMAYTEFRNNRNSSNDPQRLVYTLGPLRDSRIMGTAPNFVPLFADGRVEDDASAGPTTEIVDGVVYRFTKDLTDGPAGQVGDGTWARQKYSDFGPAHGRIPRGNNAAGSGANRKNHDKHFANFLFADGHVSVFADTNADGEFGWLSGAARAPNAEYDDDIEGRIFGGTLSTGRFARPGE